MNAAGVVCEMGVLCVGSKKKKKRKKNIVLCSFWGLVCFFAILAQRIEAWDWQEWMDGWNKNRGEEGGRFRREVQHFDRSLTQFCLLLTFVWTGEKAVRVLGILSARGMAWEGKPASLL